MSSTIAIISTSSIKRICRRTVLDGSGRSGNGVGRDSVMVSSGFEISGHCAADRGDQVADRAVVEKAAVADPRAGDSFGMEAGQLEFPFGRPDAAVGEPGGDLLDRRADLVDDRVQPGGRGQHADLV